MDNIYKIPLEYQCGEYKMRDFYFLKMLPERFEDYKFIELHLSGDMLTCIFPESEIEFKINSVSHETFPSTLRAVYDEYGFLVSVRFIRYDRIKLIYMRLSDESAENWVKSFLSVHTTDIYNEVQNRQKKQARLFFCYACGEDSLCLDMKLCPEDEYHKIRDSGDDPDKSISYSKDDFIDDCFDNLKTILICSSEEMRKRLFAFSVYYIINNVISNVIEKIDRTDDFRFIAEECEI